MTKTMAAMAAGMMMLAMLPAQAQTNKLEPLFRAGLTASQTFREDPTKAMQPFITELVVARANATTVREKAIVAAYTAAVSALNEISAAYRQAALSAEFAAKMGKPAENPGSLLHGERIDAAMAKLEEAEALYTNKPAPKPKPAAKKAQ